MELILNLFGMILLKIKHGNLKILNLNIIIQYLI